jgi:flagellar hook assembly protein FlgD
LNYPNPFTTNTRFFFEHNQRGEMLQAVIKVFTVSGRLVKTLEHSFYGEASLVNDIEWDGLDDYGDRIGRGVYVYEVKLKVLSTGESVSKYEKLVLLR